jgi:protein TonB
MGYQALLFCPDQKTARTVSQVLSELDFSIEPCTEPFGAVKKLMAQRFDAIVVDCDNEQNAMLLFKSARNSGANQAALAVAVVEGQAGVAKAFRIGANLVLTKPINVEQAKGTLRVARGLLRKGSEAVKAGASAGPGTVRTNVPPVPVAPPRGQAPAIPPRRSATPAARPPKAPSPPALAPSVSDAAHQDAETLFEPAAPPGKTQTPARVREAPLAASAKPAYPWQRAAKPAAEPTSPALHKAAETASPEQTRAPGKPVSPGSAAGPTGAPLSLGTVGAAPATAKEKETVRPSDVMAPSAAPQPPRPKPQITVETRPEAEVPARKTLLHPDVESPSFSVGLSDWGEEDEGSKTKAIAIIAAVVLLAASAAYLGWKNSSTKRAVQPSVPQPVVTQTLPEAASDSKPEASPAAAPTESADASEDSPKTAPTAAPKTSPAIKAHAKESSASAAAEAPQQEPAPEPLVVKRDKSSATAAAASAGTSEPVQPPSTLGVVGSGDTKELANISNVAVGVPKPVPQVVNISQGVSEGLILKKVAPRYPSQALQLRIQGSVEMQATINKQGNITDLKVLTGDRMLARAAQEAVKQWRYKPYYLNGEPVDVQTMITVNFSLPN